MRKAFLAFLFFCGLGTNTQAAVVVTIQQVGPDVVGTATGSLNVTSLSPISTAAAQSALAYASPTSWLYAVGSGTATSYNVGTWVVAQPLQSSAQTHLATGSSGLPVGVARVSGQPTDRLQVPVGYVSGSPINASASWSGQTLSSLGLTPGTFIFDYGTDRIVFQVVASPIAVPALSTLGLFLASLLTASAGLLVIVGRMRHAKTGAG